MSNRTFEDAPARREQVPLVVGLMGPSGGGKTFSALRLATGIRRVVGGEIFVIDTEARRSLHYADRFQFRHVPFLAPFSPLDYLAAIEHCQKRGASVVVVDSMSHEHEGPGGVLEMHEAEQERLAKAWSRGDEKREARMREAAKMSAWGKPKGERRRLINSILQMPLNFVFCFRAKEKLLIKKGEDPAPRGFMPQAGEEFIYEMAVCALLPPNSKGHPRWRTEYPEGEGLMIKLPGQFESLLMPDGHSAQLSEGIGEQLATWAAGGAEATDEDFEATLAMIAKATTPKELNAAALSAKAVKWDATRRTQISEALEAKRASVKGNGNGKPAPIEADPEPGSDG